MLEIRISIGDALQVFRRAFRPALMRHSGAAFTSLIYDRPHGLEKLTSSNTAFSHVSIRLLSLDIISTTIVLPCHSGLVACVGRRRDTGRRRSV